MTAVGAALEKPEGVYRREVKNTSETLNIVTKDNSSLAVESLFLTKIVNQRTLQFFTHYKPWLIFHF